MSMTFGGLKRGLINTCTACKDSRPTFAFVGQVGHIGLQDYRTTARQGAGFGLALDQTTRLGDAQIETLDKLAQEVAGALGAARILAENLSATASQFQDRKAMAADGDYGRFAIAAQPTQRG
jgi:hypothetical protein